MTEKKKYAQPRWAVGQTTRMSGLVEDICQHGIGHPNLEWLRRHGASRRHLAVHGCDRCCARNHYAPKFKKGYKLMRRRRDGTFGSLFIDRTTRYRVGEWYQARPIETPGYDFRPGFHVLPQPVASHLSKRGRVWCRVEFEEAGQVARPSAQGGTWFLARQMRILEEVPERVHSDGLDQMFRKSNRAGTP